MTCRKRILSVLLSLALLSSFSSIIAGASSSWNVLGSSSLGDSRQREQDEDFVASAVQGSLVQPTARKIYLNIIIVKENANNGDKLPGAVFSVYEYDTENEEIIGDSILEVETGSEGTVVIPHDDLEVGKTYAVQETKAPNGFVLSDQIETFYFGTTSSGGSSGVIVPANTYVPEKKLVFQNKPISINIDIIKKDKDTNEPLKNAVFNIYEWNEGETGALMVSSLRTGEGGKATLLSTEHEMIPGREYALVERIAPNGYYVDSTPHVFTYDSSANGMVIQPTGTYEIYPITIKITVYNEKIPDDDDPPDIDIMLVKKDSKTGEGLPNAKFHMYKWVNNDLGDFIAELVTDGDGKAYVWSFKHDMAEGDQFALVEIVAPEGYVLDETPHVFTYEYNEEPSKQETMGIVPFGGGGYIVTQAVEILNDLDDSGDDDDDDDDDDNDDDDDDDNEEPEKPNKEKPKKPKDPKEPDTDTVRERPRERERPSRVRFPRETTTTIEDSDVPLINKLVELIDEQTPLGFFNPDTGFGMAGAVPGAILLAAGAVLASKKKDSDR